LALKIEPTVTDQRPNIWQLQAQGNSKGLIDALQNPEADVRKRAAAALRVLGAAEALPALRRTMETEADADMQAHFRDVIGSLLAEQPDDPLPQMPTATRELVNHLKSSDPAVIVKAAFELGKLKDKTAVEALVLLFHNTQLPAKVRLTAAEALIELESAPAVVTLLAALKSKNWQTRRNAVAVLGQLRAEWAVERLAERLRDEQEIVVRTAHAALKRINTEHARAALTDFVQTQTLKRAKIKTARLPGTKPLSKPAAADNVPSDQSAPVNPPAPEQQPSKPE
jgi:HEAT repeat protein